jgi:hypothetical protein
MIHLDACPVCQPGIPDASPALAPPEVVPGGTLTAHQCEACGTAWETFWRDGWPIDRLIAPVTPEQAGRHRAELGAAMSRRAA